MNVIDVVLTSHFQQQCAGGGCSELKVAVTFEDADGSAAAEAAAAAGGSPKSPQRSSVANVCDALESSLRKARGGLNHIKRERSRVGSLIASLIGCVKKLLDQLEVRLSLLHAEAETSLRVSNLCSDACMTLMETVRGLLD